MPTLLLLVFAGQPLEKSVGCALDVFVAFGTGALFGGEEGAAMRLPEGRSEALKGF